LLEGTQTQGWWKTKRLLAILAEEGCLQTFLWQVSPVKAPGKRLLQGTTM